MWQPTPVALLNNASNNACAYGTHPTTRHAHAPDHAYGTHTRQGLLQASAGDDTSPVEPPPTANEQRQRDHTFEQTLLRRQADDTCMRVFFCKATRLLFCKATRLLERWGHAGGAGPARHHGSRVLAPQHMRRGRRRMSAAHADGRDTWKRATAVQCSRYIRPPPVACPRHSGSSGESPWPTTLPPGIARL